MCFSNTFFRDCILLQYCLDHWVKKNITFQMITICDYILNTLEELGEEKKKPLTTAVCP